MNISKSNTPSCGNLSGNELTSNSSGNTQPQSSQLAEPSWIDPGLKSGTSALELISTSKKTKKAQAGNEFSNILPKSSPARNKPPRREGARLVSRMTSVRLHLGFPFSSKVVVYGQLFNYDFAFHNQRNIELAFIAAYLDAKLIPAVTE